MKRIIRDYFTFSSRERTGILILLILVILVIGINLMLRHYSWPVKDYDYTAYNQQVDSFRKSLSLSDKLVDEDQEIENPSTVQLFPFDPNTATRDEFIQLGIKERIAGRIIAYRTKGGRFGRKEDLMKIYGFDRLTYSTLIPYITIKTQSKNTYKGYQRSEEEIHFTGSMVEINSSDTAELKTLYGIGSVLAHRIVKYRWLLGGFYNTSQLSEVYGISDSLYLTIKNRIRVDTTLLKPIDINEATEAQLGRHPYIGNYTAKAIIAFRKSAGRISSLEELQRNKIIPAGMENKIKIYLVFR
jgi:competence protein ComEA